MVVIKQYSDTQIASLNSITGRVLYDSTINALRYNDSSSYNNILLFKDSSNNVSGVNNVRTSGNFGINTSSADKQAEINSATGDCLRLTYNDNNGSAVNYTDFLVSSTGDLTVTPSGGDITLNSSVSVSNNLSITGPTLKIPVGNTAARPASPEVGYIRYNSQTSQFEGYGAGNAWGSLGGVSDVDQNTKILAEDGAGTNDNNLRFFNDGNESMRLTAGSLMGLGTTAPDKKLEINSATGDCLRLTYNDNNGSAANYVDLLVSSGGDFNITPSGNDTTFNSTMTITGATSISSTLGVTGATTLSNTTDATSSTVGGALSIAGGAGIAKKLFVGTDLAVGGNSSLTGTLGVTGATTLSSTLGVTGATTLSSTLGVTGATTLSSTLGVTGAATLSSTLGVTGVVTLSDATDATSNTAGGCLTIAGGTAIAKKLFVGGNSSLSGTLGVTGATTLSSTLGVTGATTLSSTLGVTGATLLSSTLGVTGATSLISTLSVNGAISFADTTDATSNTAGGCLTVSGGTAIAKKLFVGGNSSLTGTLGVTGATTLSSTLGVTGATTLSSTLGVTGATTLSNTNDATSSTVGGSLTVAGGAAIAKKLYVGTDITGASMIFSSSETGNLDANAFDTITQYSRSVTPSFIYDSYYNLAFNSNRSYWTSNATNTGTVSDGSVLTNYQTTAGFNGSSVTNSNPLCTLNDGNLLFTTRFNTSSSQYAAGLLLGTKTALTSVLWSGDLQVSGAACITSIAAKDINNIVFLTNNSKMIYTTNGSTFIENTNIPTGISYDTLSGSSLVWASGFNMFLIGLSSGSGIAYSSNGITWTNATTPSNANRSYIYYNPILNKAFAYNTGTNTLLVTSNGTNWTSSTLPSLTGTTFGQFLNNTHTGLVAIYPDPGSSVKNLIYSVDGTTWNTKLITSTSSIPGNSWLFSKENIVVFSNNVAFWSVLNSSWQIALTSPLVSEANIFKLNYLSGYLANQSKTGYQWYSSSTNSSVGTKIMEIDNQLDVNVPQYITDATNSTSSSTGSLRIAGGVGIAKDVNIGQAINVTGATTLSSTLSVTGAATFSSTLGVTGATTLSNTTDATSSTVGGSLTVAGGAGIAKKLFVGTDFAVGGNSSLTGSLGVTGATTLSSTLNITGATTLSNTTDATSSTVGGSLTVAGGAGIAKKLFVGTDFAVGGNSTLTGTLGVTGATTLSSTLGVTGATTLSSTLGVTGATTLSSTLGVTGVVSLNNTTDATSSTVGGSLTLAGGAGIAKKLFVGTDFAVGGNSSLTGTLAVTGNSVLTGSLGVGTSAPDKKVEINSSTGDCLRLTNNDSDGTAANYADMLVSSTGNLTITPSGGDVNISSHNGSSTGLKLNNVLVTSTAAELNYNDTTVGIGAANKAVILDSNRNFVNLNYVEIDELAVIKTNSANNTIVHPLSLYAVPSTAAAIGLGTGIEFNSVNDTDQIYNAGYINYVSSNITTNSETGFLDFKVANSGSINSVATISNNGVLSVTSLVETSDVRSKENIQETFSNDSLEKILNVNVKTYNYIKDSEKTHRIGVIAQEIKEIIPESVVISKNDDFEDFHQVQYTSLVPHLINCIKALSEEIKELKAKLN